MKFKIEQIAICPNNTEHAMELLFDLGAENWTVDKNCAVGNVFGYQADLKAELQFNYDICEGKEFEVLSYDRVRGSSMDWLLFNNGNASTVSHFGMHVTAEEMKEWRKFFNDRGIQVAQEVVTTEHSNPAIKDSRRYNYIIYNTRSTLGVDLKFIIRKDLPNDQTSV